jgi:hypothetical protein
VHDREAPPPLRDLTPKPAIPATVEMGGRAANTLSVPVPIS